MAWFAFRRILRLVRAENKALTAEVSALRFQLDAERTRNRQREDELVDRCLQAAKLHPVSAIPLPQAEKVMQPITQAPRGLTEWEQEERAQWGEFAVEAGHDRQQGLLRWDRERGRTN